MKEWLLKTDTKNKVGRPRLADDLVVKKARHLIAFSLLLCFVLGFCFVCDIKQLNPIEHAYSLTFSKLFGSLQNKNGFFVKEGYDDENNFIMEIKPSSKVYSYSGNYKYVLYKLTGSTWKEVETKEFPIKTKLIKVKIDSQKNTNHTYKISLYILNGSKINTSFAPTKWSFSDSSNQSEKHAYKVFTVKGYYSPIGTDELKEITKKKDVINVSTDKINPRLFKLSVPSYNYRALVKYTDEVGKEIILSDYKDAINESIFKVPNVSKMSKVTFMVWPYGISKNDLEKMKLSNWDLKTDANGNYYVQGNYTLKPEKSYKN